MTALHLLSRSRLRCKPASLTMPMSNSGLFLAALLFSGTMMLSVELSDSASVPISSSPTTISATANDDADLELLASSKILMDHTSSTHSTSTSRAAVKIIDSFGSVGKADDEDARLGKNAVAEEILENNFSTSSGTDSTILPVQKKFSTKSQHQEEQEQPNKAHSSSSAKKNERNSYEMSSSPLHVARCRATCLQKFNNGDNKKKRTTLQQKSTSTIGQTNTFQEEKMLRLRRSSSTSPSVNNVWSCEKDPNCLECWKSCELFSANKMQSVDAFPQRRINEARSDTTATASSASKNDEQNWKSKQSILDCSTLPKPCLAGCQVACSYYKSFFSTSKGEEGQTKRGKNPVVATRHESVLKIVPGKITWPPSSSSKGVAGEAGVPVVYTVIQEYPDGKWRQIAQTTETSIDIPKELTSAMSSKLRLVRVLVVGTEGLRSVYSPEKIQEVEPETIMAGTSERNNAGESRLVETETGNNDEESTATAAAPTTTTAPLESNDSSSSANTNDHLETDPVHSTITSFIPDEPLSSADGEEAVTMRAQPFDNDLLRVEGPFSFELRVVSLIHQKSLVIAELRWDGIGDNPAQEYLITWELTEGGLKGHLVTDSTSVTLSLWPDTTYQIQVEEFQQNLDSDGEQPAENSSTSLKSFPIIVDTSSASFPPGSSSSLLTQGEDGKDSYSYDSEDHSYHDQTGNESGEEEEPKPAHYSFLSLSHMNFLLSITAISALLVLALLTLAAYAWTRLRIACSSSSAYSFELGVKKAACCSCFSGKEVGCCDSTITTTFGSGFFSRCFTQSELEPQLLQSEEGPWVDSPYKVKSNFITKGRSFTLGKGHKLGGQEAPVMPVAVISSSSSLSSGGRPTGSAPSHHYSYKDGLLPPSFLAFSNSSGGMRGEGLIKAGEQDYTSSSSSWLPHSSAKPEPVLQITQQKQL